MRKFWEDKKFNELSEDKTGIKGNQQFDRGQNPSSMTDNEFNNNNKRAITSIILFIWGFTIVFYAVFFIKLSIITGNLDGKLSFQSKESYSLYKPGINILNDLKGKSYIRYIQRIYLHPKEKNKMIIMVKPNYWDSLSQKDKKNILSDVQDKWEKLYVNPKDEDLQNPEAVFANN